MSDYARARRMMVDNQLRTSAVTDPRLLAVMGRVPRERFVPEAWRALAYSDAPVPLGNGRKLASPAPFARLVQLAEIEPGDRVLDLGCATGYSTAVLAGLAGEVVGVDPDAALVESARATLADLGIPADIRAGPIDGSGLSGGPFDVIVIENAVDAVPTGLWQHLADHGRLVALIGSGMAAAAHIFVKTGDDIAGRAGFNATLPPAAGTGAEDMFVF